MADQDTTAFATVNLLDGATVTASSTDAAYAVADLYDGRPGIPWKAGAVGAGWIKVDLGSAKNVSFLALFNHSFSSAGTFTLEADTADDWAPSAYTATVTWRARDLYLDLGAAQSYRWWKLSWDAAGAPTAPIVGEMWLAAHTELTRCYGAGYSVRRGYQEQWSETRCGVRYPIRQGAQRWAFSGAFADCSAAERAELLAVHDACAGADPVVFVPCLAQPDVRLVTLGDYSESRGPEPWYGSVPIEAVELPYGWW